ncbi:hypothetical protein BC835DRAFT_279620 [Cytidiella melzeri]|nr:hypothetical protein BC835DRAFT_279620 [Cytidiella melzeri]
MPYLNGVKLAEVVAMTGRGWWWEEERLTRGMWGVYNLCAGQWWRYEFKLRSNLNCLSGVRHQCDSNRDQSNCPFRKANTSGPGNYGWVTKVIGSSSQKGTIEPGCMTPCAHVSDRKAPSMWPISQVSYRRVAFRLQPHHVRLQGSSCSCSQSHNNRRARLAHRTGRLLAE